MCMEIEHDRFSTTYQVIVFEKKLLIVRVKANVKTETLKKVTCNRSKRLIVQAEVNLL